MVEGFATAKETGALAAGHTPAGYLPLGVTGLQTSRAGFGCYRVTDGIASHAAALQRALGRGINLIDTSTNYGDGGAEILVGKVLGEAIRCGLRKRQEVIVVSKAGYLQGQNYALMQAREKEGRPLQAVVHFGKGLAHCIHPDFLADQLDRSLKRLRLATLDVLLLHNPEYYLEWAHDHGVPLEKARGIYYDRIAAAFGHLEVEVQKGRIQYYGVSSNTFPSGSDDAAFTNLGRLLEIAASLKSDHHFRVVQMPFNLLEPGAVLEKNQSDGCTTLEVANKNRLGVLINRPLNAFCGNRLVRLADIEAIAQLPENDIIARIRAVGASEKKLWNSILPRLTLPDGISVRIKEQIAIAGTLTHYWRNFGSYERLRQMIEANFTPRVQGVVDYLRPLAMEDPDLEQWLPHHATTLRRAFRAVASLYAPTAAREIDQLGKLLGSCASEWQLPGSMSQRAIRAVATTKGITSVLVGMRRDAYVDDVLAELERNCPQLDRQAAWRSLQDRIKAQMPGLCG